MVLFTKLMSIVKYWGRGKWRGGGEKKIDHPSLGLSLTFFRYLKAGNEYGVFRCWLLDVGLNPLAFLQGSLVSVTDSWSRWVESTKHARTCQQGDRATPIFKL